MDLDDKFVCKKTDYHHLIICAESAQSPQMPVIGEKCKHDKGMVISENIFDNSNSAIYASEEGKYDLEANQKISEITDMNVLLRSRTKFFQTHIIKYVFDKDDKEWDNKEIYPILLGVG